MANADLGNQTSITEFILLGFGNLQELHFLLLLLFLVIYIATMGGNILIVVLVVADQHLHTPMYFFLGNLSCLETCYTSTILPRVLASLLTGDRTISVSGCITQFYFFGSLAATESYLLAIMSYDRYLAICNPLHYAALMNSKFCLQLMASSWISAFLANCLVIFLASQLTFCHSNEIPHFFCDFSPIVKLSCSDTTLIELLTFIMAFIFTVTPFLLTLSSYVCIITTILKIPSTKGRQKAFSTCSSHLIVVTIFYGTIMIVYMLPDTNTLRDLNKVFSVFYTVLTPLVNPLIYSLRNKEVHKALRRKTRHQAQSTVQGGFAEPAPSTCSSVHNALALAVCELVPIKDPKDPRHHHGSGHKKPSSVRHHSQSPVPLKKKRPERGQCPPLKPKGARVRSKVSVGISVFGILCSTAYRSASPTVINNCSSTDLSINGTADGCSSDSTGIDEVSTAGSSGSHIDRGTEAPTFSGLSTASHRIPRAERPKGY
ncbi:olfactory receptor 11A1-like [Malaclemys terrapin pileata]|uniref:olfactory receptor 11A1-like n=1 Tax=Malaclemys terrapin pileata TaxID=2991368 RepID=UPI0023A8D0EA|nr:olfactory receptor 11A1-like [Malaclemys terrapin pileata]